MGEVERTDARLPGEDVASLRITEITTRRLRLPSSSFYGDSPVPADYIPYFEFPFVTVETNAGITGYTSGYGPLGQGRATAMQVHDVYYHDLIGENPIHTEAIWQKLRRKKRHLYSLSEATWAMLDVALWDIKGKAADMPIADMLGRARDRVPLYKTFPPQYVSTAPKIAAAVKETIAAGYSGFKMQPFGETKADTSRLHAARETAGPGFPLMVDCAGELTFLEALELGHTLDELGFTWFEEPIPDRKIDQLAELARQLRTPVIGGETVYLDELPHYLTLHAFDIARGDVHLKGGITGLRKAIAMCELFGVELEIHTAASPLLDVANLHLACTTESGRFLETHHDMFRFGLTGDPLAVHPDGCQHLPVGPGLGVDIDWDWIEDHTVEAIAGSTW